VASSAGLKALHKVIKGSVWPLLSAQGFQDFTPFSAYRTGDGWIDVVQFQRARDKYGGALELKGGPASDAAFRLDVGTYYTDQHRLPWMEPTPTRPRLDQCDRHLQLSWQRRGRVQANWTTWEVAEDLSDLPAVVDDAVEALRSRALPWLMDNHDLREYMRRGLVQEEPPSPDPEPLPKDLSDRLLAMMDEEGESFSTYFVGLPAAQQLMAEHERRLEPRDHDASFHSAGFYTLYGLLVRFEMWDELLRIAREAADENFLLQIRGPGAFRLDQHDRRILKRSQRELEQLEDLVVRRRGETILGSFANPPRLKDARVCHR